MFSEERFSHYKSGNAEQDTEHKEILDILESIRHTETYEEMIVGVDELFIHLKFHQTHETELMEYIGFKYIGFHLEQHTMMSAKWKELKHQIECGLENKVITYYVSEIQQILLDHIDHYDRQIF